MAAKTIDPATTFQKRRRGLLRLARRKSKLDAMLITDPVDIHYLCGLHEGSVSLLFGDDWSLVVTSPMFREVAGPECPGTELIIAERGDGVEPPSDDELLGEIVKKRRLRMVGYEANLVTVSRFRNLTKHVSEKKLVEFAGLTVGFRAVKETAEIEITKKAVKISERAFRDLMRRGLDYFVGKSEKQIATELEYLMRGYGADRQAFPGTGIIVAAGPNSASCHHLPGAKKIRRGDAVLIDWGAELDGYRSDMTRVLFMGSVPPLYEKIYPPVEKAMLDCIAAVRPGVRNHSIDKIAREVIDQAGFGDKFPHGLGHGIGLEIHEQPRLTRGPVKSLKKNMIITVEPGIYFAGTGGARLEDDILVTSDGHENLCNIPTAIKKMILT